MALRLRKKQKGGLQVRSTTEKIVLSIFSVLLFVYACSLFVPLFWATYNSLKGHREFNADQFSWPQIYHWDNYIEVFQADTFPGNITIPFATFNTVWLTMVAVLLPLFFTACTSYVVAKYQGRFKWLTLVHSFVVTIMVIPLLGSTAGAMELNWNVLQIADKPWLFWISYTSGIGGNFLLLYATWVGLSWNYAEAAFIDGASNMQAFLRVMLPMIRPLLTALFVTGVIGQWPDWMTSYMWLPSYPTLGYAIYYLQQRAAYMGYPMYFAVLVVSAIPPIILFCIFQETIMKNITVGGLKG